jgi:hypothetical protein
VTIAKIIKENGDYLYRYKNTQIPSIVNPAIMNENFLVFVDSSKEDTPELIILSFQIEYGFELMRWIKEPLPECTEQLSIDYFEQSLYIYCIKATPFKNAFNVKF